MDRATHVYPYISKMKDDTIIETEEPDFSIILDESHNWDQFIYGHIQQEIPKDIPNSSKVRRDDQLFGCQYAQWYYDGEISDVDHTPHQ